MTQRTESGNNAGAGRRGQQRRRRARPALILAMMLALVSAATGCASGLLFRKSHLLTVTSPSQYSTNALPLSVTIAVKPTDHPPAELGIFLDRFPMPPGEAVSYFKPDDRTGIRIVEAKRQTTIIYTTIPRQFGSPQIDNHQIIIVALDRNGHRIGEYNSYLEFTIQKASYGEGK